jgi:predicted nuclease with TOPRIM domain
LTEEVCVKIEDKLRKRLQVLQEEYSKGKQTLSDLETQANNLRDTLLRISGAVQVIQEELGETDSKPALPTKTASVVELT